MVRARSTRRQQKELAEERATEQQRQKAVQLIQTKFRGKAARQIMLGLRQHQSALKIQRALRDKQQRKVA